MCELVRIRQMPAVPRHNEITSAMRRKRQMKGVTARTTRHQLSSNVRICSFRHLGRNRQHGQVIQECQPERHAAARTRRQLEKHFLTGHQPVILPAGRPPLARPDAAGSDGLAGTEVVVEVGNCRFDVRNWFWHAREAISARRSPGRPRANTATCRAARQRGCPNLDEFTVGKTLISSRFRMPSTACTADSDRCAMREPKIRESIVMAPPVRASQSNWNRSKGVRGVHLGAFDCRAAFFLFPRMPSCGF